MDIKETIADMKGIPTQDVLIKTLQEKTHTPNDNKVQSHERVFWPDSGGIRK